MGPVVSRQQRVLRRPALAFATRGSNGFLTEQHADDTLITIPGFINAILIFKRSRQGVFPESISGKPLCFNDCGRSVSCTLCRPCVGALTTGEPDYFPVAGFGLTQAFIQSATTILLHPFNSCSGRPFSLLGLVSLGRFRLPAGVHQNIPMGALMDLRWR